jgi:hypothetical protein
MQDKFTRFSTLRQCIYQIKSSLIKKLKFSQSFSTSDSSDLWTPELRESLQAQVIFSFLSLRQSIERQGSKIVFTNVTKTIEISVGGSEFTESLSGSGSEF